MPLIKFIHINNDNENSLPIVEVNLSFIPRLKDIIYLDEWSKDSRYENEYDIVDEIETDLRDGKEKINIIVRTL